MSQAAWKFPPYRAGKPTNPSTIWRWIVDGVLLPDGTRIRLEAARLGGRWLTSEQALARFIERQTPQLTNQTSPPAASAQQLAAEKAGQELVALRI
jgi:hypothetical protein